MRHYPIPLSTVFNDIKFSVDKSEGRFISPFKLCSVEKVDTDNKVVTIKSIETGATYDNVPYSLPAYFGGAGIIFCPTEGSICLASFDNVDGIHVVTFVAPGSHIDGKLTRNLEEFKHVNLPDLLQGELLLKSTGGAFVKIDSLGELMLSSSIYAFIRLDESGNIVLDAENIEIRSNGCITETVAEDYKPTLVVTKGSHAVNNVEVCYSIRVLSDCSPANILIDRNGALHINTTALYVNGNKIG